MNVKKVFVVCSALGMVAAPALLANQVSTIDKYGPYQTGGGGEISVSLGEGMGGYAAYYNGVALNKASQLANQPNIQTFCVEYTETVYPDATYGVTLSDRTLNTQYQLSVGAAYLYYNFATGDLHGYDYLGGADARKLSAGKLQHAIWSLMGEETADTSNEFWKMADALDGSPTDPNNGLYGVQVMNLWDPGKFSGPPYYQDLLILSPTSQPGPTPVPDGGLTVGMLGLAMAGLAAAGRKLRK